MHPVAHVHRNAFHTLRCVSLLLLALMLGGCSSAAYHWTDTAYTVRPGDTLYSIAFDNNLDYRAIADWNEISSPYTIYPGERIRLMPPPGSSRPPRNSVAQRATPPRSTPVPPASPPQRAPASADDGVGGGAVSQWRWPAQGTLLKVSIPGMDPKGVNIGGRLGEPIRAAADGRVVYSGNGLKGYGLLLIVKHSEHYLSAYGHNKRLDVHEGDRVRAGEIIAQMGLGPQRQPMLHFEIRRDGKPIDPRRLLPALRN